MRHYFIQPEQRQYRANLHCHSHLSDGHLTPEQLKELYRNHGYDILAITDHEFPRNHSNLSEPDFLMLTGYEAYVRPGQSYVFDKYEVETHLNLFAKEPDNETLVCYTKNSCKYMPKRGIDPMTYRRVGSERPREYSVEYINEFIRTAVSAGYLVAYNHPTWSMEDEANILAYENIFSIEMDNYSSYLANRLEHAGALYDKMLSRRMARFCHAGDDNHNGHPVGDPRSDSFGAWTQILSDELTYPAVIEAMERGDMYSSTGPVLREISVENGVVRKMPVEPVLPARSVGCAYLKHNPLSLAAQAFLELIREENIK